MRENLLCVLKPLLHLRIIHLKRLPEPDIDDLPLLIGVAHHLGHRTDLNLRLILEIDLNQLVAQSEHDRVSRLHPLLQVHQMTLLAVGDRQRLCPLHRLWRLRLIVLQVAPEMLEERQFLVELPLIRIVIDFEPFHDFLLVCGPPLDVLEEGLIL